MPSDETCPMCGGPEPCRECYEYALDTVGAPIGLGKEQEMNLTGLDLGAWLTKSGTIVLLTEYDEVVHTFIGYTVHPMREVRYGRDGRLASCCLLPGESQTVEHEQKLHEGLHLDKKLGDVDAVIAVNQVEWMERSGEAALAPHRQYNFETQEWDPVPATPAPARRQDSAGAGIYDEVPPLVNTYADRTLNASKLLKDVVNEAKDAFTDSSANIEVIPPPLREWRVLTPGGCWETVVADEVCTCNTSVDMYRNKQQVGFFVNPQAVIAGNEVSQNLRR